MQNRNLSLSSSLADQYKADGFVVCQDPVVPTEIVSKASWGMDELRAGRYETGLPPNHRLGNQAIALRNYVKLRCLKLLTPPS